MATKSIDYQAHKTNLEDVKVDSIIRGEVFLVEKLDIKKTSKLKDYYDLTVRNKHGPCTLKIWDPSAIISEGEYIELYLEGTEHSKWGKQWKVNSYIISDYPGDVHFKKEEYIYDPHQAHDYLTSLQFDDFSCKSLYTVFNRDFLSGSIFEELHFVNCPADKYYFKGRNGLLDYTYRVVKSLDTINLPSSVDRDILVLSSLFHGCGVLNQYELVKDRFVMTEQGKLTDKSSEIAIFVRDLYTKAQSESLPVEGIIYQVIERTARSVFLKRDNGQPLDFVNIEGSMLYHMHKIVVQQNKLEQLFRKNKGSVIEPKTTGRITFNTKLMTDSFKDSGDIDLI